MLDLKELFASHGFETITEVAHLSGISVGGLTRLANGRVPNPQIGTVHRIRCVLNNVRRQAEIYQGKPDLTLDDMLKAIDVAVERREARRGPISQSAALSKSTTPEPVPGA